MICEEKTQQPLPLEDSVDKSEGSPNPQLKFPHLKGIWRTPEGSRDYHRQYRLDHQDQFKVYGQRSYRKNYSSIRAIRGTEEYKTKLKAYVREHRAKYPERHKAALKHYRETHPEYFKAYRKSYAERRRGLYQLRKEEICARKCELSKLPQNKERANRRIRQRRLEDPRFSLADAMRATMNRAFRRNWIRKPRRTEALLGCSIADAKAHIEQQFTGDMAWSNRAAFVIDHWIPVAAFNLSDIEEAHLAFNWKNLRPISPHANAVKSDTIPSPLPDVASPSHCRTHHVASASTARTSSFRTNLRCSPIFRVSF